MPHPKPQRRTPSFEALLRSEIHTQSQQHIRFSSSSSSPLRSAASLSSDTKKRNPPARTNHSQIPSQPPEVTSVVRSGQLQRQNPERISRASTTESQRRPPSPELRPSDQARRTRAILNCPRLQQVTGLLPRNIDLWAERELPPSELRRLAWAMTLPEPFPRKRPRGESRTSVPPTVRKT
ncbi:hypothetical protein F5Y03DRAFT_124409 [Xylaria venustula]|nr:hypothetical protein F5Y03DRAFT_124409 [Xylaria venustula]